MRAGEPRGRVLQVRDVDALGGGTIAFRRQHPGHRVQEPALRRLGVDQRLFDPVAEFLLAPGKRTDATLAGRPIAGRHVELPQVELRAAFYERVANEVEVADGNARRGHEHVGLASATDPLGDDVEPIGGDAQVHRQSACLHHLRHDGVGVGVRNLPRPPLGAVILGAWLLDEPVGAAQVIGGLVIVLGVWLTRRRTILPAGIRRLVAA